MEKYLRVNLLGPGRRLMKKEFTGSRSHKGLETPPCNKPQLCFPQLLRYHSQLFSQPTAVATGLARVLVFIQG